MLKNWFKRHNYHEKIMNISISFLYFMLINFGFPCCIFSQHPQLFLWKRRNESSHNHFWNLKVSQKSSFLNCKLCYFYLVWSTSFYRKNNKYNPSASDFTSNQSFIKNDEISLLAVTFSILWFTANLNGNSLFKFDTPMVAFYLLYICSIFYYISLSG